MTETVYRDAEGKGGRDEELHPLTTSNEDLLAIDLFAEACRLSEAIERWYVTGILETDVRRFLAAFRLQSHDRLARDETTRSLQITSCFLLRAIVRPRDVGIIELTVSGKWRIAESVGRARLLDPGILLFPGMMAVVDPIDAIVLGRYLEPRDALQWYFAHGRMFDGVYGSSAYAIEAFLHVEKSR